MWRIVMLACLSLLFRDAIASPDDSIARMLEQFAATRQGELPSSVKSTGLNHSGDSTGSPEARQPGENGNPEQLELSRQLLGLFVDGRELPAIMVAFDGENYLLPVITILDHIGASLDTERAERDDSLLIGTPGGPVSIVQDDLQLVGGQLMISSDVLAQRLLIHVEFDQSSYAPHLSLPWSMSRPGVLSILDMPEPDFSPPSASIRSMRGDLNMFSNPVEQGSYGDYFVAGNLAGGGWQARTEQRTDGALIPTDYFWNRDYGKALALAGHSNFSLHPLLPTIEQSGIQYLHSSASLSASQNVDITRANGTRRIANGVRDISGVAKAGAVAELRVDGRVVSRTRVRLDGSYDFPDVELPTRGYAEVLVMILDNRSGAMLETQDFSRRSGIELLGARQYSLFSALGREGNLFDPTQRSQGLTGAAQWRYGLNEDMTVEFGRQQMGSDYGNQAALSMALSSHWFAALAYTDSSRRRALGLDIEGGNSAWRVDISAREMRNRLVEGHGGSATGIADQALLESPQVQQRQWARSINLRYKLDNGFSIGLLGRDVATQYESHRFILPNVSWSNRRNFTLSARPNSEGSYRLDSRFSPSTRSTLRYAYESSEHLLDYRRRSTSGQEYYVNYSTGGETPNRLEVGFNSQFDNSRFGAIEAAIVTIDDDIAYSLEWDANIIPGVNSRLQLSKGGHPGEFDEGDSELFLQWQVTFDFALAQNRIVAIDSGAGATDSAALSGDLMLNGKKVSNAYDIANIELLIDGYPYTAAVRGGRYFIDDLEPGMHKVSIDARHLPMELSPVAGQSYWVRLEKAAATEVPLALEERYSAAGRVRDAAGEALPNARLFLMDASDRTVAELRTDQFGLYRTDALTPGRYRIAVRDVENQASIDFVIARDYLFEQNLTLSD